MPKKSSTRVGELYCDTRMGGVKRWYIGKPEDADMRIPDNHLDCVCFICVKVKNSFGAEEDFFIGTGFYVTVPGTLLPNFRFMYLVTARHIIKDAEANGYSEFYVRMNTRDGSSITVLVNNEWYYHENPAVDIAAIPAIIKDGNMKLINVQAESFATDLILRKHGIGIGDNLYTVGLFNQRWGHQRNIPIVRTGIIAAMPDEPFIDKEGHLYHSYLVEMRSIAGLSGSPVFVYLEPWRIHPTNRYIDLTKLSWDFLLLGVIRGHWDLERQDAAIDSLSSVVGNGEIDRLNTGIAQVTPVHDLLDVLYGEEAMKDREKVEKEVLKIRQPTLDSNLAEKQTES